MRSTSFAGAAVAQLDPLHRDRTDPGLNHGAPEHGRAEPRGHARPAAARPSSRPGTPRLPPRWLGQAAGGRRSAEPPSADRRSRRADAGETTVLFLVMAYRSFGRFRQASTRLDTPPFSHPPSPSFGHSSCRQVRRHTLRHGDAAAARDFPADPGGLRRSRSGRRRQQRCTRNILLSPLWPRSIGTSNGPCSNRASPIATTSGSTTACGKGMSASIRDHLLAGLDYQDKLARFLENHDEPRAASEFSWPQHRAAAIITYFSPWAALLPPGAVRRRTIAGADPSLPRPDRADKPRNRRVLHQAVAGPEDRVPFATAPGRRSSRSRPGPAIGPRTDFIAYAWAGEDGSRHVVVVNYAGNQAQCRLPLSFPEFRGKQVRLTDLMGTEVYDRDGSDIVDNGLYIDHAPWHFNVFELRVM